MADQVRQPAYDLQAADLLYRFVHESCLNPDGTLNSGAFTLRRDPHLSVGISKLVLDISFERFCALKPGFALAQVRLSDVTALGIVVRQATDPEWGDFQNAHAVMDGYEGWTNKKKEDAARALRDAANRLGVIRGPR